MTPTRRVRVCTSAALLAVLTATLTGCGSGPREATCGEVRAFSVEQRIALLDEIFQDEGGTAADFADQDDAAQEDAAAGLLTLCEPEDDDETVQDADGSAN